MRLCLSEQVFHLPHLALLLPLPDTFELMSLSSLRDIVASLKSSACPSDIVPPRLFREVWDILGPSVQIIINSSLTSGTVPFYFKQAVIQSLIKKPKLVPLRFQMIVRSLNSPSSFKFFGNGGSFTVTILFRYL